MAQRRSVLVRSCSNARRASRQGSHCVPSPSGGRLPQLVQSPAASRAARRLALFSRPIRRRVSTLRPP